MEGISATNEPPAMDASTQGMDVSKPHSISPSVLNDAVSENVKNIKRKVISVSKLMEIFKNKESEMEAIKKELEAARAQIDTLKQEAVRTPPTNTNEIEELKAETELTKSKLKESEAQVNKLSQSLRSQQMLNHQLEEKTHGHERLNAEVLDLQKKLNIATKNLEQANRKRLSETTTLREKLMKATAENTDKIAWMAENRKKWLQEEETRKSKREAELESKVEELQNRLEDVATERYLDSELAKEEVKTAEEKQQRLAKKVEELHEKQKALTKTIIDLRNENSELERRLERQGSGDFTELVGMDEFEEIIPEQDSSQSKPLTKPGVEPIKSPTLNRVAKLSTPSSPSQTTTIPTQLSVDRLSQLQLDVALEHLEQLRTQFSMLRWTSGTTDEKQRIAILEEQVRSLTKEKNTLQETLLRQLTTSKPQLPFSSLAQPTVNTLSLCTPTADDTIARVESPLRKSKKRKVDKDDTPLNTDNATSTLKNDFKDDHVLEEEVMKEIEPGISITSPTMPVVLATPTGETGPTELAKRKPGRPKKTSDVVPELSKQKRKYTKKDIASATTTDFSHVEIRNISINSLVPSITNPLTYFSQLMNSPIVDDSQAHTKLDLIATILPTKLNTLFDAVQKKIPEIVAAVKLARKKFNFYNDKVETWTLHGFEGIKISKCISTAETNIALLMCLLDARFPEMDIISKFFAFAYESILHGAAKEDQLETISILLRILTAVQRAKGNPKPIQVLAYDLLRETTIPKVTLFLSESVASVWPSIFVIPAEAKDEEDPRRIMLTTFQAVLGYLQAGTTEGTKNYFATFTKRCGWPVSDAAPYIDEIVKSLLETIFATNFTEKCQTTPGLEFTIRKALELLLVYGYDGEELYNDVLKPTLFKLIVDPERYIFALPLVASVVREARCDTLIPDESSETNKARRPVLQMLNAILKAEATLSHQAQSAVAIVAMSNGQRDQLDDVSKWYEGLKQEERQSMPQVLRDVLV
ncbi:hypothetical protein FBU30_001122 [Linnemannia zychae]|nr:hypothetical protein FBU30_001122 [Linnemannia zychae]